MVLCLDTSQYNLKFAFLRIICFKDKGIWPSPWKHTIIWSLESLRLSWIFSPSMEFEILLLSGKPSPKFLQSTLSKWLISFSFTDLNYSCLIRWPIRGQLPTFHTFVFNVPKVLGKLVENWGGMSQYRISLLGFHKSKYVQMFAFSKVVVLF